MSVPSSPSPLLAPCRPGDCISHSMLMDHCRCLAMTRMPTSRHLPAAQAKYRWWVYDRWCERSRGKPSKLSDIRVSRPVTYR
mgnify:CR=1 FL=1